MGRKYSAEVLAGAVLEDARLAQQNAQRAESKSEQLEAKVERLLMLTEALWTLLKKEHGYTDTVLVDLINEIDLRNGQLDGRAEKPHGHPCPSCGRMTSAKQPFCIYCGKLVPIEPFAR